MAKYRQILQEVLLSKLKSSKVEKLKSSTNLSTFQPFNLSTEKRCFDSLELAALAAFGAGDLIAVISHL